MHFRANNGGFHEHDFCRFDAFVWRRAHRRPFTHTGRIVLLRWAGGVALPGGVRHRPRRRLGLTVRVVLTLLRGGPLRPAVASGVFSSAPFEQNVFPMLKSKYVDTGRCGSCFGNSRSTSRPRPPRCWPAASPVTMPGNISRPSRRDVDLLRQWRKAHGRDVVRGTDQKIRSLTKR